MYAVINAAPDTNVNLKEEKPLTLNMEFEMTRPMLDFLIRLHKNGESPYDKVIRKTFKYKRERETNIQTNRQRDAQHGV
jgi:hypothetical protein